MAALVGHGVGVSVIEKGKNSLLMRFSNIEMRFNVLFKFYPSGLVFTFFKAPSYWRGKVDFSIS